MWPYLQTEIFVKNDNEPNKDQLQFKLMNNGVGPALIKQVTISFEGKPYRAHFDVFGAAMGKDSSYAGMSESYRTIDVGKVIKVGEEWTVYEVSQSRKGVQRVNEIANDTSLHLIIRYSDVYDNCWQLDQGKVTSLGKCP